MAPAAARPGRDLYEEISRNAEALAASMQALHGGSWMVTVDHEVGLVAVAPDFSKGRRTKLI